MHMCVQSLCGNKLKCVVCVTARSTLVATHTLEKDISIETPQLYTLCSGLVTSSASSLTRTNYSNPITSSLGWDHLVSFYIFWHTKARKKFSPSNPIRIQCGSQHSQATYAIIGEAKSCQELMFLSSFLLACSK